RTMVGATPRAPAAPASLSKSRRVTDIGGLLCRSGGLFMWCGQAGRLVAGGKRRPAKLAAGAGLWRRPGPVQRLPLHYTPAISGLLQYVPLGAGPASACLPASRTAVARRPAA